jgi:hypothetical protein
MVIVALSPGSLILPPGFEYAISTCHVFVALAPEARPASANRVAIRIFMTRSP